MTSGTAGGEWALRRGLYDNDYFSGAQVALYIGEVLVDEVTSLTFAVNQNRTPLYGYASTLFDAVSKGNVIVQGQFTINFKEAGYLWLILNHYKRVMKRETPFFTPPNVTGLEKNPREMLRRRNIEQIVNGELLPSDIMGSLAQTEIGRSSLSGFASEKRALGSTGTAEGILESFENAIWGTKNENTSGKIGGQALNIRKNRRADEPALNPFDIYIAFGDFVGDDRIHHTAHKLKDVHLLGSSKQIVIDGQPIQEAYNFIAKDLI